MATYRCTHYSDPHPLLLLIAGPQTLRNMQKATSLPPAALLVLLAVETLGNEKDCHIRATDLQTGWLSVGLLRTYVRRLAAGGYLSREQVSRRRGKVLRLTTSGTVLAMQVKQELRDAARELAPGRWPGRL